MGVDELVGTMLALQRLAVWFRLIHMQDTGHKVFRLVNHGQLLSGENDTYRISRRLVRTLPLTTKQSLTRERQRTLFSE